MAVCRGWLVSEAFQYPVQRFEDEQAGGNANNDDKRKAADAARVSDPPDPEECRQQYKPGHVPEQFQSQEHAGPGTEPLNADDRRGPKHGCRTNREQHVLVAPARPAESDQQGQEQERNTAGQVT